MEKQIVSMKAREDIMANMKKLLQEYDYEYTDYAINKIIDRWTEQKADLINLLSKHPNYVDGQFLIAFNKDWDREVNTDGAHNFADWLLKNAKQIRENLPPQMKAKRERDESLSYHKGEEFDLYYPITSCTRFLTHCPRRICKTILV